jgi:SAM-dependent methyltransferase
MLGFPRLTFKLILMEGEVMKKNPNHRTNIIGAGEVGYAISIDMDKNNIHNINSSFWDTKGNEVIGTTSLPMYGAFISEEKCHLFGDVSGKRLLEIACGRGHSLKYHGNHKASELWGIDISDKQLEKTKEYLSLNGYSAKLICSPMEEECGIPLDYFDYVYFVYGVGWATDLESTFGRIASYLKKDGVFIFSWSHQIHKCVAVEDDSLTFKKSYFDESWYSVSLDGGAISLSDRKLSTYINVLTKAGFIIDKMIEESDDEFIQLYKDSDFAKKAKMLPTTFVIKARKL